MAPDAELCWEYGTKVGESPLLAAAAAAMGTGALLGEQHHLRKMHEQQAMEELLARRAEAERMMPTRRGLRLPGSLVPPDATSYGDAGSLQDMDPGLGALGFTKSSAPSVESVGKLVGGLGLRGAGAGAAALGRGAQAVGEGLSHGFGATGRLVRAAGPTLMEGIPVGAPRLAKAVGGAGQLMERGGQAVAQQGSSVMQGAARQLRAPAPSAPLFSKPLLSTGTKLKLMGGLGAVGAGYAGMKGLGAVRDYMSVPAGAHHQGYLRSDVNEYGY
jgi:hypothetical protein